MAPTQFDVIRNQGETALRNKVNEGVAQVRRETSLVGQASQLAGQAVRKGEEALRRSSLGSRRQSEPGAVVPTAPPPARPAPDGYMRRSPVQPVCEAADYRRRLVWRAVGAVVLVAAVCVGVYFLSQLGLLGR